MTDEKKPQTINEEAGLPDNWIPVDTIPVIPGRPTVGGDATLEGSAKYLQGSLPPGFQHDTTFVGTQYKGQIPSLSLMPLGIQGNPATNAAITSTATKIVQAAIAALTPAGEQPNELNWRGAWSATDTYIVDDVVIFNLSAYVAIATNTNIQPNGELTSATWALLAENLVLKPVSAFSSVFGAFDQSSQSSGAVGPQTSGPLTPAESTGWAILANAVNLGTTSDAAWIDMFAGNGKISVQPFSSAAPISTSRATGQPWSTNLLLFAGTSYSLTASVTTIKILTNVLTVGTSSQAFFVGTQVTFSGMGANVYLNGVTVKILTVTSTSFTASFVHADVAQAADTGTLTNIPYLQTALSNFTGANPPKSLAFPNPVTAGSTILVGVLSNDENAFFGLTSVSDGVNSYIIKNAGGFGFTYTNLAWAQNVVAGATTVTVDSSSHNSTISTQLVIFELPGTMGIPNHLPYDILQAFNGGVYVCINKTTGDPTTDPASWVFLAGDVTSVGLTAPSWLTVTGSPIQSNGTLAITAAPGQPANQVLATPNGSAGALSVRALVSADLPSLIGGVNVQTSSYLALTGDNGKLISFNTGGGATPAPVQGAVTAYVGGLTSVLKAFPSNNSAGNFIIVFVSGSSNTAIAISDTQGNTYVQIYKDAATFGASNVQVAWYAENIKAGANTVTVSWTGSTTAAIAIEEYSGIAFSSSIDQTGALKTGSGNWSTNSITTTQAEELLVVFDANATNITSVTAPFNLRRSLISGGTTFGIIADQVVSATGTYSASGNGAGNFSAQIVSFKANTSPQALTLTLPAVPPSTMWLIFVENIGAGVVTISPNGLNIDGSPTSIQIFQNQGVVIFTDGTNYFTERGDSLPTECATADLTGQGAAIATTTLYSVTTVGAGQYRLSWDSKVTTVDGVSSTLGALTVVYTDPDSVVQTITAPASSAAGTIETSDSGNVTTTVLLGLPLLLNCKASTNITYAFAYTSNTPGQMLYNFHAKLEAM